ncbi:Gfo/Idh/MocA family oxidoreductase [Candidatus Latescibacterota bacterium]
MKTRRDFMKAAVAGGIAGIVASRKPPAFAQERGMVKIGQLGIGTHGFLRTFVTPPGGFREKVRCRPYAVWDDVPGVAEAMMDMGFEKVIDDPVELVRVCDAVHVEHADYRRVLDLTRPALEAGKPVFINRPFAASIADAEEIVRLAETHDAPLMCASSLEFQPEIAEMQRFSREKGPVRSYEAYCPEPVFTWMFPHVFNYAHAGLGGGIESAYFTGDFIMDPGKWVHIKEAMTGTLDLIDFPEGHVIDYTRGEGKARPIGTALAVLTYKSRDGQPPVIGMNHIGEYPANYHITVYAMGGSRTFSAGKDLFNYMFMTLHDFYTRRRVPRPYEAILEQHRALVATNVSRLTGRSVRLDSLGGDDALPYSEAMRNWIVRNRLNMK